MRYECINRKSQLIVALQLNHIAPYLYIFLANKEQTKKNGKKYFYFQAKTRQSFVFFLISQVLLTALKKNDFFSVEQQQKKTLSIVFCVFEQ